MGVRRPGGIDELLGAFALDACQPDEADVIERAMARDPALADEVARLRNAAAWIGATEALAPPPALRDSVLVAARQRRGAAAPADPLLELYATETARLDALVNALPPSALGAPTHNGLSVRNLLIHLAAQETMLAAVVGEPVPGVDVTEADLERRTAAFVARYEPRPLDEARAAWAQAVAAVRRWARTADNAQPVEFFGLPMRRETVLVNRAFETWIHADDIRQAVGTTMEPPRPEHLHLMADLSIRTMPAALRLIGRERGDSAARVVLTGDGGGDWLVPLGVSARGARPDVTMTMDVVDWCRLASERIMAGEVAHRVEGDATLAADLLVAAPVFATL
jgi:uncharacterized protein (TIGR03083 family)